MLLGGSILIKTRGVRNHAASSLYDRALAAPGGGDKNA